MKFWWTRKPAIRVRRLCVLPRPLLHETQRELQTRIAQKLNPSAARHSRLVPGDPTV